MNFKRGQDPLKALDLGYGGKIKTKAWKILKFIGEAGDVGRGLTEIQKFIWSLNSPDADFEKTTIAHKIEYYKKRGKEYDRDILPYEKTRASRGYWNTQLYGSSGMKPHPGILNKYCKKNDKGKWVLVRMPRPGENIFEEKSNKYIDETLNEFLNNRYIK